jgi:putative restriction endonuclease
MFGGGTEYVETLNKILSYVETQHPTTDDLVGWHRGKFPNVSSRDSIMRRVRYLQQVGFLDQTSDRWQLGQAGREYIENQDIATLLQIMCDRNVGLRSLLYALSAAPMSITDVSEQQLKTHPELGWNPDQTDMAKQRVNWLRSMGLVETQNGEYALTADGQHFVENAIEKWSDTEWTATTDDLGMSAGTYETTVHARTVDPEFRATVLYQHDQSCPVSDVDHPRLLDVAHVLSWSEYPDHRADLSNVLPLSKTHHAAFDRNFFTIDQDYRLRVNPSFETECDILQQTILNRAGERMASVAKNLNAEYLRQHNAKLEWV